MIRVDFFANLRLLVGHKSMEMTAPRDIRALLKNLEAHLGERFGKAILNSDGELKNGVIILVNGTNIHFLRNLDTRLDNDDKVAIFPPVGGG